MKRYIKNWIRGFLGINLLEEFRTSAWRTQDTLFKRLDTLREGHNSISKHLGYLGEKHNILGQGTEDALTQADANFEKAREYHNNLVQEVIKQMEKHNGLVDKVLTQARQIESLRSERHADRQQIIALLTHLKLDTECVEGKWVTRVLKRARGRNILRIQGS